MKAKDKSTKCRPLHNYNCMVHQVNDKFHAVQLSINNIIHCQTIWYNFGCNIILHDNL